MLGPVIEPLEEVCVCLLCIHHLSLLRSLRPSCRTLLSYCIVPLFTLGSSSVTNTVQRGLVAASALSDTFITAMNGNSASPAL